MSYIVVYGKHVIKEDKNIPTPRPGTNRRSHRAEAARNRRALRKS